MKELLRYFKRKKKVELIITLYPVPGGRVGGEAGDVCSEAERED